MLKRVPYFLAAPKDGRDMTKKIQAKLDKYGICILGAGDFVTTGIGLPYRGTLMGMGASSRLILADEVRDGAAVRLSCYSAVKDLSIIGSEETAGPQALGERHGILFEGTALIIPIMTTRTSPTRTPFRAVSFSAFRAAALPAAIRDIPLLPLLRHRTAISAIRAQAFSFPISANFIILRMLPVLKTFTVASTTVETTIL